MSEHAEEKMKTDLGNPRLVVDVVHDNAMSEEGSDQEVSGFRRFVPLGDINWR